MTDVEWKTWSTKHASLFGLLTEQSVEMVRAWRDVFDFAGYSAAELAEATAQVAMNPPKFPTEHLNAIHSMIRAKRAIAYKKEVNAYEQDRGTCGACGGSGRIVVPHLKGIEDGQWKQVKAARGYSTYYTMAVLCQCGLGHWVGDHISKPENRPMSIETYERCNPHWKAQMFERHTIDQATAEVGRKDLDLEKSMKDLKLRVAEHMGLKIYS